MIGAIIENKLTKETEYLYYKNDNNNLSFYGFNIINNQVNPIDKNIIYKIYNILKINDECVYIEDYLDYQVYLDKENNIKHYIKDGKEDFIMLFKNNGEDLRVYNQFDTINAKETKSKKFNFKKFFVSLTIDLIILISFYSISSPIIQAKLYDGNIYNNYQYKISKMLYYVNDYIDLDINSIDSTEAIELIKNSNLSQDLKEIFSNEELLNNIFPYYKNTKMEYLIKSKLQNLKLRVYEPTDFHITDPNTTDGFYDELAPNVLNVKNTETYKEAAKHEFIHLLQSPDRKYIFLHEALAEIVSSEYLDKEGDTYIYCVFNVSLLMDVIGPQIIWETVFSGDDTNLKNILKSNLTESDYNELITYLTTNPTLIDDSDKAIRFGVITSNLYRNINNKEIRDDRNIFNEKGYHIKRVYFNEEKMLENKEKDGLVQINEIFTDQIINKNIVK